MECLLRVVLSILIFGYADSAANCNKCGVSNPVPPKKGGNVVHGDEVTDGQKYPWMVSLSTSRDASFKSCSAAIISKKFILTAAHCLTDDNHKCWKTKKCHPDGFQKANEIFAHLWGNPGEKPLETLEISKVIPHESFQSNFVDGLMQYDIGLLQMKEVLKCHKYASPICIPVKDMNKIGQDMKVMGYGFSTTGGQGNGDEKRVLREGLMKQVKVEQCMNTKTDTGAGANSICAVAAKAHQVTCQGDSGSSYCGNFKGVYYSIGISSAIASKHGGCPVNLRASFTKTYSYLEWIRSYVRELPSP